MDLQSAFVMGVSLQAGLVVGFGPQNIFVLENGLSSRGSRVVPVICSLCDLLLIVAGVTVVGRSIVALGIRRDFVSVLSAAVIALYGFRSLLSALGKSRKSSLAARELLPGGRANAPMGRHAPIFLALAFSLLNPLVCFDLLIIVGAIGAVLPSHEQVAFIIGATLVSSLWFTALTYGAERLRHRLESPSFSRAVQLAVSLLCFAAATQLYRSR